LVLPATAARNGPEAIGQSQPLLEAIKNGDFLLNGFRNRADQ
jgi:hypothetical protein